jgi:hypothetical protein
MFQLCDAPPVRQKSRSSLGGPSFLVWTEMKGGSMPAGKTKKHRFRNPHVQSHNKNIPRVSGCRTKSFTFRAIGNVQSLDANTA